MNLAKLLNVNTLLWLALVLALIGSLYHLANVFASIDGKVGLGWLQAVAIDAGLFALAYSIKVRKASKRSVKPLWFGLTMFTLISIYGNLAYGLMSTDGQLPYLMLSIKPYVLAASLPILVLFLSELLSDDRQHAAQVAAKQAKKAQPTRQIDTLSTANAKRSEQKALNLKAVAGILAEQPDIKDGELAKMVNVSRATIGNYRKELNGSVSK